MHDKKGSFDTYDEKFGYWWRRGGLIIRANLEIPMHDSIDMAVMNTLENLLYTMGCVCLAIEFTGNYVLEEFTAGDSINRWKKKKKN